MLGPAEAALDYGASATVDVTVTNEGYGDLTVSDVMIHRTEMVTVCADDPPEEVVKAVLEAEVTRIPSATVKVAVAVGVGVGVGEGDCVGFCESTTLTFCAFL